MFKKVVFVMLVLSLPMVVTAEGSGQAIEQIYYCGEDFAMKMSGGDWYLVQKSRVGEKKLDHFLSLALFMMASGKTTANVFPGDPIENWCGNSGFRPINIFSVQS